MVTELFLFKVWINFDQGPRVNVSVFHIDSHLHGINNEIMRDPSIGSRHLSFLLFALKRPSFYSEGFHVIASAGVSVFLINNNNSGTASLLKLYHRFAIGGRFFSGLKNKTEPPTFAFDATAQRR